MNLFENNEINDTNYQEEKNTSQENSNSKLSSGKLLHDSISSNQTNISENNNNDISNNDNTTIESPSPSQTINNQTQDNQIYIHKKNELSLALIDITSGLSQFSSLSIQYYFKDILKANPSQLSIINSVIMVPSITLPLYGLITDMYPLLGYRRKSYIILFGCIKFFLWLIMACFNHSMFTSVCILFLNSICRNFNIVIIDAIVVELNNIEINKSQSQNNKKQKNNPMNQSFFYRFIGMLIASILRLIAVKYLSVYVVFFLTGLLQIINIVSGFNYYETNITKNLSNNSGTNQNIQNSHLENSAINNNNNFKEQKQNNEITAKRPSIQTFLSLILTKTILLPILFLLSLSSMPSTMDSSFYYLSDEKGFNSQSFGALSIFITLIMLFSMIIYKKFLEKIKAKRLISGCLVCSFLFACIFNLWILFNLKSKFIVFFSMISSLVAKIISIMPVMNLASLICPKGYEGSVFSLFVSSNTFGKVLSNLISSVIVIMFGIKKGNYKNFNTMVFFTNLFELFPILVMKFIPQRYLSFDKEQKEDEVEIKENENVVNVELEQINKERISKNEIKNINENEEQLDKE